MTAFHLVGAQLAHLRVLAGYTQPELAKLIIVSEDKYASIEQGRRPLTFTIAQELDRLLDTKGVLEVAVAFLPGNDVFPVWAAEFFDHEREALTLASYENQVLPGLLQTEAYVRAVFRTRIPAMTDEETETQVAARLERQTVLTREERLCASFIVSEATLKDRLGGEDVFRNQLRHLRKCADVPDLTLQVMPLGLTSHAGLSGPFSLFETPQHEHLAYAETQRGSQVVYDQDEVSILTRRYAMLRAQALNPEETKGLLDRLLGE